MYITINIQNKYSNELRINEGSWSYGENPADAIRGFIQFCEGYEPIKDFSGVSEKMTEKEFNDLYEKGQRIFWLETYYLIMIVKIQEEWPEFRKIEKDLKDRARLFEDMLCYASNYHQGFYPKDDFGSILDKHILFDDGKINIDQLDKDTMELLDAIEAKSN